MSHEPLIYIRSAHPEKLTHFVTRILHSDSLGPHKHVHFEPASPTLQPLKVQTCMNRNIHEHSLVQSNLPRHQAATAISSSGSSTSAPASRGFFWNSFLSCPQAALASNPRVWRTLTVILWDSKAAENATICVMVTIVSNGRVRGFQWLTLKQRTDFL